MYYVVIRFDGEEDEDAQIMADDLEREIGKEYRPQLTIYRAEGFTAAGARVPRE